MSRASAEWKFVIAVGALALLAALPSAGNGFVYDDAHIILRNPLVHDLSASARIWSSAYWPAGLAYRPLTVQLFALEWAVGGGSPLPFHLANIGLAVAVALLVWRLARRVLPSVPAAVAAGLFAVHPVHVEVIANSVGQAELLVALLSLIAVERYLAWRSAGAPTAAQRGLLALLTALAVLAKETGYVIPILVIAAEIVLVRARQLHAWRWREAFPTVALQMATVVAAALLRIGVIGATTAAGPSVSLMDLSTGDRIVGMLAVVPHWGRLLLWPAHMQAEYGPPALTITGRFGVPHAAGLAIVLCGLAVLVFAWRRSPVTAFGLAWVAVAVSPVSNVVAPTGVILAERTLFLPSVGMMLALGAVATGLHAWSTSRRARRVGLAALATALLALALYRSATRGIVWRDQDRFFAQLAADAPTTYRAHKVAAEYLGHSGKRPEAEARWRRALELYEGDGTVFEELGQLYRAAGQCERAIPVLERGLVRHPSRTTLRARFIECRLALGDTAHAVSLAREAVALGHSEFEQTVRRLTTTAHREQRE